MKECGILRGTKHTLTRPTYFQGIKTPNRQDLRPWQILLRTDVTVVDDKSLRRAAEVCSQK